MILNIIAFKNVDLDASTTPSYIDVDETKAAVQLSRSLKLAVKENQEEVVKKYRGLVMYKIGEYDDVEMKIVNTDSVKLLDCDAVMGFKDETATS